MTGKDSLYMTEIERHGSLSRAAEQLMMSQSTLSRCLQKLEAQAGTALFRRTAAGLVPTDAGRRYLQSAHEMLRLERELQADLTRLNNMEAGRLVLGTTTYLGALLLPRLLRTFAGVYPGIEVVFSEEDSLTVESQLLNGSADLALLHPPLQNAGIAAEHIADDEMLLVLPGEDPANAQALPAIDGLEPWLPLEQVAGRGFVLTWPHQRMRQQAERLFATLSTPPQVKYTTRNPHTALRMVEQQLGPTLLPRSYLRLYAQEKGAARIYRLPGLDTAWAVMACTLEGEPPSRATAEMIRVCKATLPYLLRPTPVQL